MALVDDIPRDYPAQSGVVRGSPLRGSIAGLPMRGAPCNPHYTSDDGVATDTSTSEKSIPKRHGSRRSRSNWSGSDSDGTLTSGGRQKKRMDFLVKSKYPNLGARRVILMMWPMPLGSGPTVSLITVNTKRIPTSCLSWYHP